MLDLWTIAIVAGVGLFISTLMFLASRYKRCPSDKILVIYGKVGSGQASNCIHGGGTLVWPLIQDYMYLSLTPMTIAIPLSKALSQQNIRINVPSTFTVGVSTEPEVMQNAAERLLHLNPAQIEEMAKEIIFGQLRLTVASLTIEQINQDRERFLEAIRRNVAPELSKIGLYLINVNITDITDESGYIDSIGKKAASEAVNQAKVDVAEQDKLGAIGESTATRERTVRVAENVAEAEKGKKKAEADQRVYVQGQEAEADQRVYVQGQEAEAVAGENRSKALIAESAAELQVKQAIANQRGEVAHRQAEAEIQKAQALAEMERLKAAEVVRQEVEKQKIEIAAEAEAEKVRREAKGTADGILLKYEAEAKGLRQVLESKAAGYQALVESCGGDAKAVATLLMTEKIEQIVQLQVEAIRNIKIDKVTVWDSGAGGKDGTSSTAGFLAGMAKSLPPLHDVAAMAGIDLPKFMGEISKDAESTSK